MSMLKTLAKVAIGIAVAKGIGGIMKGGSSGGGESLGGANPQQAPKDGGDLQDILGDVLSGGRNSGQQSGKGGLGDLLEQLGGGARSGGGTSSGGGLGDLLGGLANGQTRGGDPLGDVFGDFLGDKQDHVSSPNDGGGSFGDIFNDALARDGEPEIAPSREQEMAASLMLRAMIQAAKSDGEIDREEEAKLIENLGDVSAEEREFVNAELRAPVDVAGLANQVPAGLEQQVYLMSIMGIDLDNRREAEYLHELATELGIDRDGINAIHDHLGVMRLYK